MHLDHRLHAFREDLADARLKGKVTAARFTDGVVAWICVGRSAVRQAPNEHAPCETFYHYGERVRVFEQSDAYAWCQSDVDGYVGYIKLNDLNCKEPHGKIQFVATMGSYIYNQPDIKSAFIDFLPRHARILIAESQIMTRGSAYAQMSQGGYVPMSCIAAAPPRSTNLVEAMKRYLGCPYLWGGKSFLGIDCSGLVQSAFLDLDIHVLRDTDMQCAGIEKKVAVHNSGDLEHGDVLYMPGHVAVYDSNGMVIHADGHAMSVQMQDLAEVLHTRGISFDDIQVHRPAYAAMSPRQTPA